MKVNLKNDDSFEERLYDRDNGPGAAARVIAVLRSDGQSVNAPEIRQIHQDGKLAAAARVKTNLFKPTIIGDGKITLGLADVADVLGPAVDKALD